MLLRSIRSPSHQFWLATLLAAMLPMGAFASNIAGEGLQSVHAKILKRHAGVQHMSPAVFAELHQTAPQELLVLDVREPEEHRVSHIPGAVRVPPGMSTRAFLARFGDQLAGRKVVLYCSVGERSSRLAKEIDMAARAAGAAEIHNLTGGIFNWHNQKRPLMSKAGQTDKVHPYNWWWSRLVERRELTSYEPVE